MFGNEKKAKRFVIVHSEGFDPSFRIIKDTVTGVKYLYCSRGYSGGITPLLDKDGKPIVKI
jgi:hypothetical protein